MVSARALPWPHERTDEAMYKALAWAGRVSAAVSAKATEPDDRAPSASSESDRASSRSSAPTIESDGFHRLPNVASTGGLVRYTHIGVPAARERGRSGAAEPAGSEGSTTEAYTGQLEPGFRMPHRQLVSHPPSERPPSDRPAHSMERPAGADARFAASDESPPPPPPPPSEARGRPLRPATALLAELRAAVGQVLDAAQASAEHSP
jgi:hypothetical protein